MTMNKLKKSLMMTMAAALVVGTMGTTSVNAASKAASGYGTLTGTLSGTKTSGNAYTKVTKNPDRANITLAVDLKNKAGNNVVATKYKSERGVVKVNQNWASNNKNIYSAYGAHGVQGGTKYKAYVVYTYSSLK